MLKFEPSRYILEQSKSARDPAAYRRNEIEKLRRGEGVAEYNLLQVAPEMCSVVQIDAVWRPIDLIPARWVGHIIAELEELDEVGPEAGKAEAETAQEGEETTGRPKGKWLIKERQKFFLLERLNHGHYIQKKAVDPKVAANLFDPSKDPLPWDGKEASQSNLAYFILTCVEGTEKGNRRDKLFEPSSRQYWVWAAKCFIGKAKKTYDNKTLASEAHRFAKKGRHPEYIDDIINRTYHSPS